MSQALPAHRCYHQPHLSIYIPIAGYWKEAELVSSIKQRILEKIELDGRYHSKEISDMITVINKFKAEGQTRNNITILCAVILLCGGMALISNALVLSGLALSLFALHATYQFDQQSRINRGFIQQLTDNPRDVDYRQLALDIV